MAKQMFVWGGGNLQNNLLTRNIKEFNVIFLVLIAILIIGIAGGTSLALFSGETSSSGKITGKVVKKGPPAGETIIAKVGTGGLVADSHPTTTQLAATTAYRYTGKDPDNYVTFNNELWRIIGVFDVDDGTGKLEQRIKIIRNESIGLIKWDSNGITDWSKATGMTLLNSGDYWNRTGSYASTGLTEEAKQMIDDARWYLGGTGDYVNTSNGLASHFYSYERNTTVYGSNPISWVGKVGLMYVSDYGYATSGGATTGGVAMNRVQCLAQALYSWNQYDCASNNWLYSDDEWVINSTYEASYYAFNIRRTGYIDCNRLSFGRVDGAWLIFRPCVYLSFDVSITGGTGTKSDPYTLSL